MRPGDEAKYADKLNIRFNQFHTLVADVIKRLLKSKNDQAKDRVMQWLRKVVSKNLEL